MAFTTPLSKEQNLELKQEFANRLAKKLREIRAAKRMTQQEVSERSALHLTYYAHLERGQYHPSAFVLWKVAKALNIQVGELFTELE